MKARLFRTAPSLLVLLAVACGLVVRSPGSTAGNPVPGDASTQSSLTSGQTVQPAATVSRTHTPRSAPHTMAPEPTAVPSPTPPPRLRQLTTGGCCVNPFWSSAGSQILFVDRPSPDRPAGIWGVPLDGGAPILVLERLGLYSDDMQLLAYPSDGVTIVERSDGSDRWAIANGGRSISFAPNNEHVAWTAGQSGPPFDTAQRSVWVSRFDGTDARELISVYGGGFAGWHPDGRVLATGRLDPEERETSFWAVPLEGDAPTRLMSASRFRRASLSPEGGWLAYEIAFSPLESENGLWVADLRSGDRRKLTLFGAFRWRSEGRLLVVPLDVDLPSHQVWEVTAFNGAAQPLTDPAVTAFKISNGNWGVSPNGRHIAFVATQDRSIWLLTLPPD